MATIDELLNLRAKYTRELTLDDACQSLDVDHTDAPSRQPIWRLFQQLEESGHGRAVVGRKGGATRFVWATGAPIDLLRALPDMARALTPHMQTDTPWTDAAASMISAPPKPAIKLFPYVPLPDVKPLPVALTQAEIEALSFLHKVAERAGSYATDVHKEIGLGYTLDLDLDRIAQRAAAAFKSITGIHPKDTTIDKVGDWKRK